MSQCTLAQQNSIVDLIRESFEIYGSVDLNDLELEISQVLLEGFTFKEFSDNTDIINTLKEYGVNTEELIGNVSSSPLKSNVVKNISTYKVEDLFKGIPTAKLYFDGYLDNLMVKNAIIGSSDSETYVSSDLELTSNLHNLKNNLFIEIQDFLKSKGILTTDPIDLFENGRVKDFSNYSHVMNLISEYFFSGNDVSLFSFSGKLIPNLNISLEDNESVFRAYNNMILLSNFDSVLNNMFKGMIEVNYNYFNHLDSVIDNKPKYKLKVSANSLLYWNNDTHDSKSSENKEDKITKMIVGSIPMYNKTNVKTSDFMEMKDLYLLASMIHNFELKFGNKFKNNDNYNFEYFNVNSNDSLYWYIAQIKKSINKEDGFISELNESLKNDPNNKHGYSFKNISNIIYSLDNFLNDSELNIEAKEKTSKNSLVSLITQVLNNNYGSTYSVFDTKHGLKVQNMYQQDFNNTYINDTVLNYMKSTDVDKNMYNLRNPAELTRFNKLFDPEGAKFLPDDIETYVQENPNFVEEFSKYITEKTGIPFSRMSFQTLVTEMKDFHNLPVISGDYLKNKLGDLIRNMQTVKSSKSFNDFTGNSDIETSGKILSPVVSSSFYITLSNVYLANFVTKPIMNIETAVGNKVPSFRSTVLVFKDTELFDLQREFQKDKNYKSLLLTDVPAILGTSTKLEINSTDSSGNVTSKDAVKATVGESFISDFRYEFWDSIIKNDTFQIILGNYSDKNSVFTKIINANYNLPNSKIPVIQEDIGKILQTVRLQGLNFYTDSLNRIFTDYKELLSKTGYAKESNQLSDNIENNIKVINSVLSKANIIDLIRTYSKLPYDQKSKDLTITEELHYSYYSDGTFINQTLADNYRIFGDEDLFAQFVEMQENSFIDNYNNEFPKSDNKIIFNNVKGLKTNEFNKIIEKLNIPKDDFSNNADMESLVLNSGEINPIIKKWLWLNSLFRNEYVFMTAKGEHMHPHKNNSASRSGEFNEDYWDNYRNEVSGRLSSMAKRNVIFTASVETPTRNTKMGVPDNVNVAAIVDNSASVFTPSGYKKYNQDAYDGSSYIDDTYNRMIESSFPGKGYSGTKKQFGTLITPYGVTIKKDAETVITNDKIRNSFESQVSLLNKKKQMLGIPLSDLMLDFEQEYYDKYFLDKGLLKSITKVKLEYNPITKSNQIKIWTNTETNNGWFFNKPETHPVNTLFDVWSVLGGMYSVDEHRNFTEGSNELLYDIVTNDVALKDKIIHILSNKSALKAGATNLNHKDSWFNDDTLMYSTYKNRFMGPQLDASHGVDNSEIKEITQLISALAQNGYTSAIAQEAYNDIASVIKKSAQPYIDNLSSDNSNLYQYLTNKFIDTINNSKGESLAKSLIHHLKQDKVKIPFSNVNFFNMFVKDVVTRLNDEFISRHYSGIGSVLLPSHGVIQLYDKLVDGREIIMTQQDLIKEALINYNQEDFVSRYGRKPQSNFEIIEDYKNIILADEEIVNNYFEVGDTIKLTFFDSNETLYTLTTPEDYYKLKEIISQYQQNNVRYNLFKVKNVPRDLKPTMHNFSVNNVRHNVYDFKSIKMLYTLKNLISDLKKGKTIDINSDLQDLSEFGDVIAKRNNSSYNLLSNLTPDSLPVISELEKHLRRFVQREFDLLNHNLYLDQNLPIANVVGNDTFLNPVTDVLQHYSSMSNLVENLNFKPAEKIIGDIYQTIFNRDSNDSMYDIYNQGSEYFKNKISKYYDNDTTESDLKIYTSRSDNPIYIKYVDELGPLDRTINISSSIDSDEGLKKAYIRYNEQGEEVYSFADPDNIRVSTDENGNEIIYIKYGTRFKNGHHRSKSFNKNLKSIIRSFKGSLQAIVPLMNRDDNKVNFYNYIINDAGKSIVDENNISEFNLSEVSVNIFKNFSGYNQDVDNYYDSSWVQVNKENILNTLSNKTFASWQKSHDLIDARIPGQSMQSFMPMRNVAYMNTLTNDSYVSINQIFLQGSDFDIDKAYTLGSTFTSKGNLELWSDLTNYSTIEQLNELEKLPIPSGVETKLDVSGIDITNDYLEIEQTLKNLDYSYELPTKAISLFNALIRKIGNNNVIIKDVLTPVNINEISDFEGTSIMPQQIIDFINKHNLSDSYLKEGEAIKNSIVSRIKQISANPSNQIIANTPVDVQDWHDAIKKVQKNRGKINKKSVGVNSITDIANRAINNASKNNIVLTPEQTLAKSDDVDLITFVSDSEILAEVDEENEIMEVDEENITESDYLSPYDLLSYYRQQYNASVGKDDVGIAANGVKSLYALSSYYNTYYGGDLESDLSNSFKTFHKTLTFQRNGKTLTLGGDFTTIADVQMSDKTKNILVSHNPKFNVRYVNAANNVSGFLSAATDNAKELIMAKVNASTDLAAMHLYMLILGFDIEAVVEIMTSDEMSEIIEKMKGNIFTTGSDKSFLNIVKSLKSEYVKEKDWDKVHNLNTYENIYRSSQELTTLSRLLGINQKRSADTWEIYKYLNIFSKAISDAESKYTIPKQLVAGKLNVNLDKYAESLVKENKVPLDLNYVKNVLINAEKHNILDGSFDFEQYFANPEYKQVTKEYYNIIKETFNIFDIIDEVPHFKEMVNSLVLFHNILKKFSSKYDYIFDTYRDVTSDQNPDKKMLNRGILYYDTKSREDWLKSESMLDFTFNLKELMKLANKNEINIYVSSEARMNSKKDAYTTTINVDDDSNPIISLDTNEGIANFKLMFEQLLLPVLQANLKDSNFLKLDSTFSEFGLKRTTITPTIPLSNSNVPALIKQFQKALLNFNNLDRSFDIKYQIKNNTGEYVKWRDLLFVYNLLINNERYGNKRLTPLFQDYMQEKDTLGYDYIKFWSDIDSNRDLSLDNSDIQFYALNEKGVLNRMVSNNPDFVITTDLKTTETDKIYNKNINDIVRLLKEGGFIITLKC